MVSKAQFMEACREDWPILAFLVFGAALIIIGSWPFIKDIHSQGRGQS